ncbi:uncharacterized protein RHO25_007559 [Cercospora beticola]|uniref:Uncharacterized protein n=1 Tax=Cercospora beticola TaxID=122368 RepID=A0ABZ0NTS5_CERBT|nr:hypothetical protein RHO25_007559 [Cercospora beticola]
MTPVYSDSQLDGYNQKGNSFNTYKMPHSPPLADPSIPSTQPSHLRLSMQKVNSRSNACQGNEDTISGSVPMSSEMLACSME